jgi:hypothetical protein
MSGNRLTALASTIRAAHEAASRSMQDGLERAFECGRDLIAAKVLLARGTWEEWVPANLGFSAHQARLYMRLARRAREIRTSKSGLNPKARFSLEKALASVAVPQAEHDAPEGGRPASKKSKRSPGSTTPPRLEDLLHELAALEFDPAEVAQEVRDPERLQAAVEPAYHQLRLLYNALDKRLKSDGKRPAPTPQPLSFLGDRKGMLQW